MGSDGLTKGSIDRTALLEFASGIVTITQPRHTVRFTPGGSPLVARARAQKVPEVPEDDESKSIAPVKESITNPVVEVNLPPVVPAIVGLGSVSFEQYSVAE